MSKELDISIKRITNPLVFTINRVGEALSFNVGREGTPLAFKCGIVMDVNSDFYLNVPTESIWLIPDNDFSQDVVVYSNVTWTIE